MKEQPPPMSGCVPMSEVFSSIMNQKSDVMLPAGSMLPNLVVPDATGGGSPIDAPTETKVSSEPVTSPDVTANNGFEHPQVLGDLVTSPKIGDEMQNVDQDGLDGDNAKDEYGSLKEEFPPTPSDNQSILVTLSSRCVSKWTVCERSHLFRIKYYGNCDKPLGRFLRDNLFDQNYRRPLYALLGENDGKIWMWHRCLKCPRIDGSPPAIRRIVMSDSAWGLSFGKFLDLSFSSNHATASRVANCGHTLHRDCLRFYGFWEMVACFRYASINEGIRQHVDTSSTYATSISYHHFLLVTHLPVSSHILLECLPLTSGEVTGSEETFVSVGASIGDPPLVASGTTKFGSMDPAGNIASDFWFIIDENTSDIRTQPDIEGSATVNGEFKGRFGSDAPS
nr:1-phosphatidylinositol-3-phosphate 5-kinase FAB1A isoform X1 [Tanacetum cinerariifolium]